MKILAWCAARGWALGGAIAGGLVASLSSPPYYLVNQGWFQVGAFGSSAVLMFALAWWPWKDWLRQLAVSVFLLATLARSFGLAFLGEGDTNVRHVAAVAWALVAFFALLLGVQTIQAGHRARK